MRMGRRSLDGISLSLGMICGRLFRCGRSTAIATWLIADGKKITGRNWVGIYLISFYIDISELHPRAMNFNINSFINYLDAAMVFIAILLLDLASTPKISGKSRR